MDTDGQLIELIQSFPHLYDMKNKNFKNLIMQANSWQVIANTLKLSGKYCFNIVLIALRPKLGPSFL